MECEKNVTCSTQDCQFHKLTSTYIALPLIVAGVISNAVCIFIWKNLMRSARKRNVTCGVYLITIGVTDIGVLTSFFFVDSITHIVKNIHSYNSYNIFYCYIFYPAFMFFTFLSFWLIAGVDTCRLTMVLFPFKMRQSSSRVTNTAIVAIIIYCFGVNVPNFLSFKHIIDVQGVACIRETHLYKRDSFFQYRFYFQCIFLTVFPWSVIVLVNSIMLVTKYTVAAYVPKIRRQGEEMGRLLFVISIWFVCVIFWQCVAQCFYLQGRPGDTTWSSVNSSFAFAKLGMILNSSMKFFIYTVASPTFRTSALSLIQNKKSTYKNKQLSVAMKKNFMKKYRRSKSLNAVVPLPSLKITSADGRSPNLSLHREFKQYRDPNAIRITF